MSSLSRLFHLETKGEYGKQASEVFAVLINKDNAAGISLFDANSQFKKAKFAYYAAYHDKKERWSDGKDPAAFIKTGLDAAGMSQADFETALKNLRCKKLWKNGKQPMMSQKFRAFRRMLLMANT